MLTPPEPEIDYPDEVDQARPHAFIVSTGEYSDYLVVGIYTNQEMAKKAWKIFGSNNSIEAIQLDELPPHRPNQFCWRFFLSSVEEGKVLKKDGYWYYNPERCQGYPEFSYQWSVWNEDMIMMMVWGSTYEEAEQKATTRQRGILKDGKWKNLQIYDCMSEP